MTAKEYLKQVGPLKKSVASYLQELEYWKTLAENVSGSTLEEHYNPNHSESAPFEYCMDRIVETRKNLEAAIAELTSITSEILRRFEGMNSKERLLLQYRYMESYTWERICNRMQISERTALRIHGSALKNFSKK